MKFLRKNWSNILLLLFIILLLIPQTRKPLQVGVNRLISFSPSAVAEDQRQTLKDYHWTLVNMNEEPVNLNQSLGEVVVINIWATWCPPCIAEMPSFQKLYNQYGERIDFYFISSEETEKIQMFLDKKNYRLPVYQPLTQAPHALNSNSLPTTYVISRKGTIVVNKTGAANWNDSGFKDLLEDLIEEEY